MKRIIASLVLLGVLLAVGIAAPCQIRAQFRSKWSSKNAELQEQLATLAALSIENARLNRLAVEARQDSLSSEQFRELIRLRGEIGLLRQAVAEIDKLRASNERARSQLAKPIAPQPPPDSQKILASWPKSQLTRAGHSDPRSAVESMLCAMTRNDPTALAACVTPDAKSKLTREHWNKHGSAEQEIATATQKIADSLTPDSEFYVIDPESEQGDHATIKVYFEGENLTRKFILQKIEDEWKFASLDGAWP
jgi:hypothetical protein